MDLDILHHGPYAQRKQYFSHNIYINYDDNYIKTTKFQKMLSSSTLETKNSKTPKLLHFFLLPQANGQTCVDFGCTHPIDVLFWSLPIYLLGFF
jgi:hypothetical protein